MVVAAAAAEIVCGVPVRYVESARAAAKRMRQRGPTTAAVTLGADGAVLDDAAAVARRSGAPPALAEVEEALRGPTR